MKLPPWILIVVVWGVLLAAIFFTLRICRDNAPEEIALDKQGEVSVTHAR